MNEYFKKILTDGKNIAKVSEIFYPCYVIAYDRKHIYHEDLQSVGVMISSLDGEVLLCTPAEHFLDEAAALLKMYSNSEDKTSATTAFIDNLFRHNVKDTSKFNSFIKIFWLDLRGNDIGSTSTLLNASGDNTNFVYSLGKVSPDVVKSFNCLDRFKKKFELLSDSSISPKWVGVGSRTFYNNLMMIDTCLPWIVGECLLYYYSGRAHTLVEAEALLRENNPLNFDIQSQPIFYEYKLKQFLLAFALGMTAAKSWNGKFVANGGYIVVKEDGEIVCYHFFDRNELEDYLFNNTYFDTPSTKRHNFGEIYSTEQGDFLKLNLQVRFIS